MEAYKIRRKFKNDKALYFNMQRHPGLPHGLWVWRVHWVRERCARRIGDGRAEEKDDGRCKMADGRC